MNTDPAGTRSPHLDLAELIAEVTGQAAGAQAREHLASCERCRTEATRWNLVADGVRGLAAAAPEEAPPALRRPTGLRALAQDRRRTVLAASAAAALVLLAAAGYGATAVLTRHTSGTVLTAVSGCAALKQASGTLEQVNGSSLVIKTASGQPVTVTTTASTFVAESGPLLSDITDGASVTVAGPSSDGTIAASAVTVERQAPSHPKTGPSPFTAQGTVSDVSTAGFTLITSGGARIPVSTASATVVTVINVSLGRLPAGATAFALGQAGPDGTLSARGVAVLQQLPQGNRHLHVQIKVQDCSPASIVNALAFGG